jgi:hypothetical protein
VGPNVLLSTLFSNTLSASSSPIVTDQVSHPQKQQHFPLHETELYRCVCSPDGRAAEGQAKRIRKRSEDSHALAVL